MAAKSRRQSEAAREIGDLPKVAHPRRRKKCERNFLAFCESYFPKRFDIPWSPDHLKVIAKIEQAVLRGGLFALAMPRGSGKTALCVVACIWAVLYGHRKFVVLIGADESLARELLEQFKAEIEYNPRLGEDFPEACYPIAKLEGILNRCPSQTYQGQRTEIVWKSDEAVMPKIPKAKSSQAIIRTRGIEGRIRGMSGMVNGRPARPDLVIVDDPQTDASAKSLDQSNDRVELLMGTVLGLAGPRKKISGIIPCTVIQQGDMADQILSTPIFQGERCRMLYSMPTNMDWWDQYARLRDEEAAAGGDGSKATALYVENREIADEGAVAAWPERFNEDEASAIQHAMNLYYLNRAKFFSEYQNDPQAKTQTKELPPGEIRSRVNGLARGVVPLEATTLTAYVDVQGDLLYWLVAAWRKTDFTGWVVDYGTWPEQGRDYFSLSDARPTISQATGIADLQASLLAALETLCGGLATKEWPRESGSGTARLDRIGIDANWGQSTETVYSWARRTPHAQLILPGHGKYIGPTTRALNDYQRKPGDLIGPHWRIPGDPGSRGKRHIVIDTNYWKTQVHTRLACAVGQVGGLSLFGNQPHAHRMLADHLTAEQRIEVVDKTGSRELDVWKLRPERPDNHFFDCLVGAMVLASTLGVTEAGGEAVQASTRRVRYTIGKGGVARAG